LPPTSGRGVSRPQPGTRVTEARDERREDYRGISIGLHWLTACLFLFDHIHSDGMGRVRDAALEGETLQTPPINATFHVWVGACVFVLVVIRLVVRAGAGVSPVAGGRWLGLAAIRGHRLLYALMVLVPVSALRPGLPGSRQPEISMAFWRTR
jgi:cytochrome b561